MRRSELGDVELAHLLGGASPAASYDFLLELRRAKAASLAELARAPGPSVRFERMADCAAAAAAEAAALERAKRESRQEAAVRAKALGRLAARLECPWALAISAAIDDSGNCQFDAAADQLRRRLPGEHGAECTHERVRARVVAWLRANPGYVLGSGAGAETLAEWVRATQGLEWEAYCAKMATPREWGDEVTMKAITEAFRVRIFLWSSTVSESNYFSEHVPRDAGALVPERALLMCHVLEVHYSSVVPLADAAVQKSPDASIADFEQVQSEPSVPRDAQVRLLQALFVKSQSGASVAATAAPAATASARSDVDAPFRLESVDRLVPNAALLSVAADEAGGGVCSVRLERPMRFGKGKRFYVVQVLVPRTGAAAGDELPAAQLHLRWGVEPHDGQSTQRAFDSLAAVRTAFERRFRDKTGVAWRERATQQPLADKYAWTARRGDGDDGAAAEAAAAVSAAAAAVAAAEAAVSDATALTASIVERVVDSVEQPAAAIGTLMDLRHGKAALADVVGGGGGGAGDGGLEDEFVLLDAETPRAPTLLVRCGWHDDHTFVACFFEYGETEPTAGGGDWLGLFDIDEPRCTNYLRFWRLSNASQGIVSGTLSRKLFGALEFRLVSASGVELARSEPFLHGPRLQLGPAVEGNKIVVKLSPVYQQGGDIDAQRHLWRTASDWLGLYRLCDLPPSGDDGVVDDDDVAAGVVDVPHHMHYLQAVYLAPTQLASASMFTKPAETGLYEVRFFSHHRKYTCLSRAVFRVE